MMFIMDSLREKKREEAFKSLLACFGAKNMFELCKYGRVYDDEYEEFSNYVKNIFAILEDGP